MSDIKMRPRVTKQERKLHLNYELPHRIHTADIYSIPAPNGSNVLLYGYDNGLKVLWRGCRRRKEHSTTHTTNGRRDQPTAIDGDDEEVEEATDDYESEEEEIDPDCPYPNIIQELEIDTGSSVLHISTPSIQDSSTTPRILRRAAVVVIASTDSVVRLLQIPLAPPAEEQKQDILAQIVQTQIELPTGGHLTTALAVKFVPVEDEPPTATGVTPEDVLGNLLVAVSSRSLSFWAIPVTAAALVGMGISLVRKASLQTGIAHVAFHPSTRSTQLLVADRCGAARIYDQTSSDPVAPTSTAEPGKWVSIFHTSFHAAPKDQEPSSIFSRRKKILDARWVLAGRGILALLEDGQWGIWETYGPTNAKKPVEDFAVEGYLNSSTTGEPVEPTKPRKGISKLAPMTPNTRKTKAEELFKGASKVPGAANLGGISVASTILRPGQADESVVMWYNSDIYSITSMQSFWQRSLSSGGGFGSLYSPGLSHITDIDLINENISSISQFTSSKSSSSGQMNTQRDLLVAGEHRAVILQHLRAPGTSRNLFQLSERPASRGDVPMMDAGDSELDRINAALDKMTYGNAATKSVGFAH